LINPNEYKEEEVNTETISLARKDKNICEIKQIHMFKDILTKDYLIFKKVSKDLINPNALMFKGLRFLILEKGAETMNAIFLESNETSLIFKTISRKERIIKELSKISIILVEVTEDIDKLNVNKNKSTYYISNTSGHLFEIKHTNYEDIKKFKDNFVNHILPKEVKVSFFKFSTEPPKIQPGTIELQCSVYLSNGKVRPQRIDLYKSCPMKYLLHGLNEFRDIILSTQSNFNKLLKNHKCQNVNPKTCLDFSKITYKSLYSSYFVSKTLEEFLNRLFDNISAAIESVPILFDSMFPYPHNNNNAYSRNYFAQKVMEYLESYPIRVCFEEKEGERFNLVENEDGHLVVHLLYYDKETDQFNLINGTFDILLKRGILRGMLKVESKKLKAALEEEKESMFDDKIEWNAGDYFTWSYSDCLRWNRKLLNSAFKYTNPM